MTESAPRGLGTIKRSLAAISRADRLFAGIVIVGVAVLYAQTMAPGVWWYDSAEFAARAASFSAPHPPGYPSYILLAQAFVMLGPEPAWGLNFMSATFGVAACVTLYWLQRELGTRAPIAAAFAFAFGVSPTVWLNASIAEVYTPGLFFSLATLALLARAVRADTHASARRCAITAALLAGFGCGVHLSIATLGVGLVFLAASMGFDESWAGVRATFSLADRRRRGVLALACLVALLIGLSTFVIFPLLSSRGAVNWTQWWSKARGGLFVNLFAGPDVAIDFWTRNTKVLHAQLGTTFAGLAVIGAVLGGIRRPRLTLGLVLAAGGNLWFFWNYRVQDPEVFFLPAVATAFALGGVAVEHLGASLDRLADPASGEHARSRRARFVALVLGLAVAARAGWGVPRHAEPANHSRRADAQAYLVDLIDAVPHDAVFVTFNHHLEWKHYAVLLYAKLALRLRHDVDVLFKPAPERVVELLGEGRQVFVFHPVFNRRRYVLRRFDAAPSFRAMRRVVGVRPPADETPTG